jgi:hypothetical protein
MPQPAKPQKGAARQAERLAFRTALIKLLHREQRFGLRDDCRIQLDGEWNELIALAEKLFG